MAKSLTGHAFETMTNGQASASSSLEEFNAARNIFQKTLLAMKQGGEYPIDLK